MPLNIEENGIVPILEDELNIFENNSKSFRSGEMDPIAFQVYRLREGVYGQRQPGRQQRHQGPITRGHHQDGGSQPCQLHAP